MTASPTETREWLRSPARELPDLDLKLPWRWAAIGAGLIIGLTIALFQISMPLQVSDHLSFLLLAQRTSFEHLFHAHVLDRPAVWLLPKLFLEIPPDAYFAVVKVLHVAMTMALLLLGVRLLAVRTPVDFAAATIALYVLVGMHTFVGFINESFPINNHLAAALATVIAANLAYSRGGILADIGVMLCFVVGLSELETGFLVLVVVATGYALGWRGVSLWALGVILLLTMGYFVANAGHLAGGGGLIHNSSGFGFSVRDPAELQQMFAGRMYVLFAYNVVCSVVSIIFAEPKAGVWDFTNAALSGTLRPHHLIEIGTSLVLAGFVGLYIWRHVGDWLRMRLTHSDRLVLMAGAVLFANAAISFAYLKDVTLGTAGVFWAIGGYAAIRDALIRMTEGRTSVAWSIIACFALAVMSAGFVVRSMSAHYSIYKNAFSNQSDWVDKIPAYQPITPEGQALMDRLKSEALVMPVPPKALLPRWLLEYENR